MHRIKELRKKLGYTQKDLAEKMKTTQQTIGRWEKGDADPNIQSLRELACIFGTSIDYLVENEVGAVLSAKYDWMVNDEKGESLDGFWGHIGVLPKLHKKSKWYPVTKNEMKKANWGAQQNNLFSLECLNNKILVINPKNIQRIVLNNDDADEFWGDWDVEWHATPGTPLELYNIIEVINYSFEDDIDTIPKKLLEEANNLIIKNNLSSDDIAELTEYLFVYREDGCVDKYCPEGYENISSFLFELESDFNPETLIIDSEANRIFYTTENISLLEFPLLKVHKELNLKRDE
jgi:transcriptional regulator with XRE-family HTH domain